jgi:lactoylglutathione lyase
MRIEHVALWARDLEKTKNFYVKYFNGRSNEKYYNEETGFQSYFLTFEGGARLEIMNIPTVSNDEIRPVSGYSHIAFSVGSKEKVDSLTKALVKDNYKLLSGPRTTGDGYYESCIEDPDGNRVEITI